MANALKQFVATAFAMALIMLPLSHAQDYAAFPSTSGSPGMFSVEQIDQLLAPIALYPDTLISQVLMAATYPLDVIEANRWIQAPPNAALSGNSLAQALEQQPWDPSVKALVQFPQVLRMMDANLGWTERLGEVFLAQQQDVMDAIQRLRRSAQTAGALQSTPQQMIQEQTGIISILPANPQVVYVPYYDPSVVYGAWSYPSYPPYYFPPPPGLVLGGMFAGIGFGIGIGIIDSFWGWSHWDWPRHRIEIDVNRYNAINPRRPPVNTNVWQHDATRRGGIPPRGEPRGTAGMPTGDAARREFRGYAPPPRPVAPGAISPPRQALPPQRPAAPVFESMPRGAQTRPDAERGRSSREATPRSPPPGNMGTPRATPAPGAARPGGSAPPGGAHPGGAHPGPGR